MTISLNLAATLSVAETEHMEVHALAAELAGTAPGLVDEIDWLDRVRSLSNGLPESLRRAVRDFRRYSGEDGLLLIRNLPVDSEFLPPTPTRAGSVQREATVPAAVLAMLMSQLGELVAYRQEKSGALVQNVVPVPGQEKMQGNAGSTKLEMHTENAFHPHRPDFLALLCLRSDHEGTAGLQVACIRRAVGLLPQDVRATLAQPRFITTPPPSFDSVISEAVPDAVLTGSPDDPDLVVDFAATRPLDGKAKDALLVLGQALVEVSQSVVLGSGDLVIVDNRVSVHGRSAFVPRYDGHDRWLQRSFVHLNFRRSRAARAADGHVIDGA